MVRARVNKSYLVNASCVADNGRLGADPPDAHGNPTRGISRRLFLRCALRNPVT